MTNSLSISERLQEVFLDGKLVANTNYKEQLSDVDKEQALMRVGQLNSIAMLTYHINYYLDGVLRVLHGGPLDIHDKYSFEIPIINSENEWQNMKNKLLSNAEQFIAVVAKLSDQQLNNFFTDKKYGTYQRNLEVMIEHSYYHLGQITLIKKLILLNK